MKPIRASIAYIRDHLGRDLIGAEVGAGFGNHAECICHYLKPKLLYCIDSWTRNYDTKKRGLVTAKEAHQRAKDRLVNCPVKILKMTSLEASKRIKNRSLDFVYIDADHAYQSVKQDIRLWTPKVKRGGIVGGHDFGYSRATGVIPAVTKHVYTNRLTGYFRKRDWWVVNK